MPLADGFFFRPRIAGRKMKDRATPATSAVSMSAPLAEPGFQSEGFLRLVHVHGGESLVEAEPANVPVAEEIVGAAMMARDRDVIVPQLVDAIPGSCLEVAVVVRRLVQEDRLRGTWNAGQAGA